MLDVDPRDDFQRLVPYLQDFAEAALMEREDTCLLCAVALRETWAGWAPGYIVAPGQPRHLGRGDNGHGFGIFQLDDRGPYGHLPRECPEASPYLQAQWACTVLHDARRELAEFKAHHFFERAVLCAYNAGSPRVARALRIGVDPDLTTTGNNYGSNVLHRRDYLRAHHPVTFPPAEVA